MEASAVSIRIASFNIEQGFGAPGQDSYDQAQDVIRRVGPDVIAIIEARGTDSGNFNAMAAELGYPYKVLSGSTTFDTSLRTGFFSRYPITVIGAVSSPGNAKEMTRANLVIQVDVPNTDNDPTLVAVHYKCCGSTGGSESFRRAIEARRTKEYLQARVDGSEDNVFIIGDYNFVSSSYTFNSLPSGLPKSYSLGSDVSFPVTYSTDPDYFFSSIDLAKVSLRQANGSTATWSTQSSSKSVLDYIVASAPVRARGYSTEIYNSSLEASYQGLRKPGPLPASNASSRASDHYLVFGDFELDDPYVPTPLELWAGSYGLSGADAGANANPAGDGIANIFKYAFGGSPLRSETGIMPFTGSVLIDGQRYLACALNLAKDFIWDEDTVTLTGAGVSVTIEQSTDLIHWETASVLPFYFPGNDIPANSTVSFRSTMSTDVQPTLFFRFNVVEAPAP